MNLLVTLITTASTSMNRWGNSFHDIGWQFYTDILQGFDIPASKNLNEKKMTSKKIVKGDFFIPLSRETAISTLSHIHGNASFELFITYN